MVKGVSCVQRSLELLRSEGGYPDIVERFVKPPRMKFGFRKDLWNFVDIVCMMPTTGELLFVQVTSMGGIPEHRRNCFSNPLLPMLVESGGVVELHGWRKLSKKDANGKKTKVKIWECFRERYDNLEHLNKQILSVLK